MLRKVEIENYKAFKRFKVEFGARTLLVGPNNAGKTTLVSALRLIAHLVRPGQLRRFEAIGGQTAAVRLDLDSLDIPTANLAHNYAERPSTIRAHFDEGLELRISLEAAGPSLGSWYYEDLELTRPELVRRMLKTTMGVVPPVAPLEMEESVLTERYVRRQIDGPLSPRHFRNQWLNCVELSLDYASFKELVQETLPGLDVLMPEVRMLADKTILTMNFREGRFVGEIGWAGHGIQVWLQILSHLVRLSDRKCVILDEPDVYLHPDLQRRIVALGKSLRLEQFIVASHSVDILNEFAPEDIVIVDKSRRVGRVLGDMEDVQRLMSDLGSTANINVARLVRSRTCLFVEGDDFQILRRVSAAAGVDEFAEARDFAVVSIEGFSNWERLRHVDWVMRNLTGETVKLHVMLDRDYRCEEEVAEISAALGEMGVRCHVWKRKELENYLLVPEAIAAAVNYHEGQDRVTPGEIEGVLRECADNQRHKIEAQRMAAEFEFRRRKGEKIAQATLSERVLDEVATLWEDEWVNAVGGKEVLSEMRRRLQEVGIHPPSNNAILASMQAEQIDEELVNACRAVVGAGRRGMRLAARPSTATASRSRSAGR